LLKRFYKGESNKPAVKQEESSAFEVELAAEDQSAFQIDDIELPRKRQKVEEETAPATSQVSKEPPEPSVGSESSDSSSESEMTAPPPLKPSTQLATLLSNNLAPLNEAVTSVPVSPAEMTTALKPILQLFRT